MFTFIEFDNTDGVRDAEASRMAEEKFRTLLNSVTDCMLILDRDGHIRNINRAGYERLGYTKEEIMGMHITQLEPPGLFAAKAPNILSVIEKNGHTIFESAHVHKNGSVMPVEVNCKIIVLDGQEVFFSVIRDITERKREQRLRQMMQFSIDHMVEAAFWLTPDAKVIYANAAACRSLDYSPEEITTLRVFDFDPETTPQAWPSHWEKIKRKGSMTMESNHRTRNGHVFPVEIAINYLRYEDEEYHCVFTRDITKRKQAEERIIFLAHFDAVTKLPNRTLFYDRLEQSIAQAQRYKQKLAILFLDLDGFKKVNDNFGHCTGDGLLKAVAERLNETARSMDTVARVGGDEFVFILNDVGQAENAATVAKKVVESLARPFAIHGNICSIGGSIGISIFPDDTENMETLVKQADDAMYLAKSKGKNNYQFFSAIPYEAQQKTIG